MMTTEWMIGLFTVLAGITGAVALYPLVASLAARSKDKLELYRDVKVLQASKDLDDIFMEVSPRWLKLIYGVVPVTVGVVLLVLTHRLELALLGTVAGVVIPDMWLKQRKAIRQRRFRGQLVDALLILSSSLRAGLSMTQAFEQLVSEMSPPASQEFGLMLKAHRLGRTLEESLRGLNSRMASEELELLMTAVLVARETGGDVTQVISQLVTTIRERQKLRDKVNTLTVQGRMQAYILSLLPIGFAFFVRTINPNFFDILINDPQGRLIIAIAVGLWITGMVLLMRLAKVNM